MNEHATTKEAITITKGSTGLLQGKQSMEQRAVTEGIKITRIQPQNDQSIL
ncbi:hypothetical protein [Paenibacillus xylanexedens]|uniref:hypothetical protein n=1 Tax=Paenibacillus xylanexedens TaxID=528191 RepID=UPI0021B400AD|nr:hypothetical protein [Paenibacillus xylanexedens]